MNPLDNDFKTWLTEKRHPVPLGTWMMTGSDTVAEAMGYAGFDFLVLDTEHVPVDSAQANNILRALTGTPTPNTVLRLAWNDPILVKRALDGGATTLMFPFIQNRQEAEQAISSARYPMNNNGGTRGVAAVHRASRYGTITNYLQQANDNLCLILQLETPEALANIDEIANVEGVDALFIGPGDLSAALGYIGDITHTEVQRALKAGLEACHAAGKPCGIVGGTPQLVTQYIEWGYDFVAIASDMSMMLARAKEQIAAVRGEQLCISGGTVY